MRKPLRFGVHPPRCHCFDRRVHHALPGFLLVGIGLRHGGTSGLTVAAAGVLLIASDWRDRRDWARDFLKHPNAYPAVVRGYE